VELTFKKGPKLELASEVKDQSKGKVSEVRLGGEA
jgi:hypothetical protein